MREFHTKPSVEAGQNQSADAIEAWKQQREASGSAEAHTSLAFEQLRNTLSNLPVPDFELSVSEPHATQKQAAEQTEHLYEMRVLVEAVSQTMKNAEADRARSEHEQAQQKTFNKRMTIAAITLSFAAVVVPFLIFYLEHGWWWEPYRP
ncbi:hypothetical protein QF031_002303 [Pseudarthrobacter defluvii]|uniref:hypothetical protein n=1 Tax=Pseudarthrobacter defluvii TaxID=410837 RepID=UPI00278799AE|nr:hypothetical protein [Pseudarthrobacter defluvii]MDQ0769554.1 hypothetical protein [Pseudarthrobacter defluvii]